MENTRHERALVVAASYIIGFTSAFIAFGVSNIPQTPELLVNSVSSQAQVVTASAKKSEATSLRFEDAGLVVVTEDLERLLSARRSSSLMANVISSGAQSGFAVSIVEAEISRDGQFVYYCEQQSTDSDSCVAYVYSVVDDIIHPVQVDGSHYNPKSEGHMSTWTPAGYLNLEAYRSVSANTPWVLN